MQSIILSIKPEFVELILNGSKTVELRRVLPRDLSPGSEVIIYASSPVQRIVARACIKRVERHSISSLWKRVGGKSGVPFDYFKAYFTGKDYGYGLVLDNIEEYSNPIPLSKLRASAGFTPPQSFRYTDSRIQELLAYA